VVNEGSPPDSKHGALTALGFLCQDLSDNETTDCISDEQANSVLTAVIHGLRAEETSMDIKLAAAEALDNAIEFAHDIFTKDQERNFVMQQVCQATEVADVRVRKKAMDCLVTIAYYHYDKLPAYIEAISQITIKAIKQDEQEVGTTALELWSTITEEELDIMEEIEMSGQSERPMLNITVQAVSFFVPVLLECLTKQTGQEDDDDWTVYKAAGVCLELVARCAKDDCVDLIMTFVNSNVRSDNWVLQDAATLAFGALLDGPSEEKLRQWVDQATKVFIEALDTPQSRVELRDTTAWAIAKILENHPTSVSQDQYRRLLEVLLKALSAEPRVAVHVCFALEQLTHHIESMGEDGEESSTNALSGVMAPLLQALVKAADRPDASELTPTGQDLMSCAYDALDVLVKGAAPDCAPLMIQLCPVITGKLQATFQAAPGGDRESHRWPICRTNALVY